MLQVKIDERMAIEAKELADQDSHSSGIDLWSLCGRSKKRRGEVKEAYVCLWWALQWGFYGWLLRSRWLFWACSPKEGPERHSFLKSFNEPHRPTLTSVETTFSMSVNCLKTDFHVLSPLGSIVMHITAKRTHSESEGFTLMRTSLNLRNCELSQRDDSFPDSTGLRCNFLDLSDRGLRQAPKQCSTPQISDCRASWGSRYQTWEGESWPPPIAHSPMLNLGKVAHADARVSRMTRNRRIFKAYWGKLNDTLA